MSARKEKWEGTYHCFGSILDQFRKVAKFDLKWIFTCCEDKCCCYLSNLGEAKYTLKTIHTLHILAESTWCVRLRHKFLRRVKKLLANICYSLEASLCFFCCTCTTDPSLISPSVSCSSVFAFSGKKQPQLQQIGREPKSFNPRWRKYRVVYSTKNHKFKKKVEYPDWPPP